MKTTYRIRRTKLKDETYCDFRPEGHVTYLEHFAGSSGRSYRFSLSPRVCVCGDQRDAINFKTVAAARKKLKTAAVMDHLPVDDDPWFEMTSSHWANKIEVVELVRDDEIVCGCCGQRRVSAERVIWPVPPVLDRLAAIW